MTRTKLAVALIVKNEEEVLDRCLSSLKPLTPNILVMDTGSTDSTVSIAKSHGAQVRAFTWIDDFAAARNASFAAAIEAFDPEYIMWVDADDVLHGAEVQKILDLLHNATADMFVAPYVYASDENNNPVVILSRERIVKASKGYQWEGLVHETIPLSGVLQQADFKVHHHRPPDRTPTTRNVALYEGALGRGTMLSTRDLFYYGTALGDVGRGLESRDMLTQFVSRPDAWWEDKATAYLQIAHLERNIKNMEAARRAACAATGVKHSYAEAYCFLGEICVADKQWTAAIHWYLIAAALDRPADTMGKTDHAYYTWIPHLQLCLCYAESGREDLARKHNEEAAKYVPHNPSVIHNRNLIGKGRDGKGKRLNLGCGGKRMPTYVNCDLFPGPTVDEAFSLDDIPYADGTISAIHSEHAIEHLPRRRSFNAIKEWARVLQPGGELLLKLPDIELICQEFLNANEDLRYRWWHHTIFGVQEGQAHEPDEGQFHYCGYTKSKLKSLLEEAGFIEDYLVNYDGWDTPSIACRAIKKRASIKIGWFTQALWDDAGTRLRALNVDRWLRADGYDSKVVGMEQLEGAQRPDVLVYGKQWDASYIGAVARFRDSGGRTVLDISEDYFSMGWPNLPHAIEFADAVVTCSAELAKKVKDYGYEGPVTVIGDGVETIPDLQCAYEPKKRLSAVWMGYGGNAELAENLRPLLDSMGYDLTTIHEWDTANVKWNRETWDQEMVKHDIAIAPQRPNQMCKSNVKFTTAAALGLPVIMSPLPAYLDLVVDKHSGYFASNEGQWKEALTLLWDENERMRVGLNGRHISNRFRSPAIKDQWLKVLIPESEEATDIIIPTFNNPELLEACIKSIKDVTDIPYAITVVDVGTKSADHEALKRMVEGGKCLGYKLIKPEQRTSFSASNNLALKATKNPWVCLLNDDTIVTPGWLTELRKAVSVDGYGISGPTSNCDWGWLHHDPITVGGVDLHPGMSLSQVQGILPDALYAYGKERQGISGQVNVPQPWFAFYCVMMRRSLIEEVGLLDETFINGGEDVDYCKRAEKFGYKCVLRKNTFVLHFGGKSRKVSEESDPERHHREDRFNNNWLQKKYEKPTAVFYNGPAYEAWSPQSISKGGIGGSETALIHMASELQALGYRVTVFNDCREKAGKYGGIEYRPYTEFPKYVDENWMDVFISSRDIDVFRLPIRAGKKLCWVHDIFLSQRHNLPEWSSKVDKFLCLSQWHKGFFVRHHGVAANRVVVTRNGIDLTRYQQKVDKVPARFIWSSSADRGLDVLLDLWPQILEMRPDATLHVAYGFENWEKAMGQNKTPLYHKIMEGLQQPGIKVLGRLDQTALAKEQMESEIWAYCTPFSETYCITALEAQAAGCTIVASGLCGLLDSVGKNGDLIPVANEYTAWDEVHGKDYQYLFMSALHGYLVDGDKQPPVDVSGYAWSSVAKSWVSEIF